MWYQNIRSASFSFVTIHASDRRTDGRTDRQTELRQQYRALYYMPHGKNVSFQSQAYVFCKISLQSIYILDGLTTV